MKNIVSHKNTIRKGFSDFMMPSSSQALDIIEVRVLVILISQTQESTLPYAIFPKFN